MEYDSVSETLQHSRRVGELLTDVIQRLVIRATRHDHSKCEAPERDAFDVISPRLKHVKYNSPEYKASLDLMRPAIDHHYRENRHHPEHFLDGIDGMNLVDIIEMLADWRAATERHEPASSLTASMKVQKERFGISDQLMNIMWNTLQDLNWDEPKDNTY